MVYVHCQAPGCWVNNGEDAREALRNAAAHVASTGHVVKITGTPASVVKDQTLVLQKA